MFAVPHVPPANTAIVVAAGLVDILTAMLGDFETLAILFIGAWAIVFVGATWTRTRSIAPTIGAILLGAVVIYAVSNYDFLKNRIDEDVDDYNIEADNRE